jgi:caspase domain-containing protein
MRRALIIGIDHYISGTALLGCVDDAHKVKAVLERHGDGAVNFDVRLLTAPGPMQPVLRSTMKDAIAELFSGDSDIALFYFAGHGHLEATGGYILASDSQRGDEGVSLAQLTVLANASKAKNKIIVLDSCHSGIMADVEAGHAALSEGLTILTASTAEQHASEDASGGVFTDLFVDALSGAAANLLGQIGPGSVYAHIDQSLGAWAQRPVFKTNVRNFVALRHVTPAISLSDLRQITTFFPYAGSQFLLDPSFEPEPSGRTAGMPAPDPDNTRSFALLQKYNRVNLVVPVDAPHMWHAAMESKSCSLTVLGEHYRRLAASGKF